MAKPNTIGNMIAPPRFLLFLGTLAVSVPVAANLLHGWALGTMAGFDAAAFVFLIACVSLLGTCEASEIREHAAANDANRSLLLVVTGIVMLVLLTAISAEAVGRNPEPETKGLIVGTLVMGWLFSNSVYALHYAHLAYMTPADGCTGLEFPGTKEPVYWDFVYFAFTLGMAFATSDVQISSHRIRRIVILHSLAAFVFNIGVLAFTISVLSSSNSS